MSKIVLAIGVLFAMLELLYTIFPDVLVTWFMDQLQNNEIFAGLAGGAIIAPIFYSLKEVPGKIWDLCVHQFTVELSISNDDDAFEIISEWFSRHSYTKKARKIKLTTWRKDEKRSNEEWSFSPGVGRHLIWHRGWPFMLSRAEKEAGGGGGGGDAVTSRGTYKSAKYRETFIITTIGRKQAGIRQLITDASAIKEVNESVDIYIWNGYWMKLAKKTNRLIDSVILGSGIMNNIIQDFEWFFASRKWYEERGVPYRRGYAFTGPPGTGKSSLVMALSSYFKLPIYILNLNTVEDDNDLLSAFTEAGENGIILIEDIDTNEITKERTMDDKNKKKDKGISLSGLLNVIDGVASADSRIFIATTNHPDNLDKALMRPGRIDMLTNIGLFSVDECVIMFKKFYPEHNHQQLGQFTETVKTPIAPAELQHLFMLYADSIAGLLDNLKQK